MKNLGCAMTRIFFSRRRQSCQRTPNHQTCPESESRPEREKLPAANGRTLQGQGGQAKAQGRRKVAEAEASVAAEAQDQEHLVLHHLRPSAHLSRPLLASRQGSGTFWTIYQSISSYFVPEEILELFQIFKPKIQVYLFKCVGMPRLH